MAAVAGSSMEESVRQLRDVLIAAASNAPEGPAEAGRPMLGSLDRRGQPSTANSSALSRLMGNVSSIRAQHPPSLAWVGPMTQQGIVPAAAAVVQHVLRAYRNSPDSFRIRFATGTDSGPLSVVEGSLEDPLLAALMSVWAATQLVKDVADSLIPRPEDYESSGPTTTADAVRLLCDQLEAPATLQALADAVRWVEAEVWPLLCTPPAGSTAQPTQDRLDRLLRHGCEVVASVAFTVRSATCNRAVLITSSPPTAAAVAAGAAGDAGRSCWPALLALLAALADSQALAALAAAVMGAPPCPAVAADASELPHVTSTMSEAEYYLLSTLHKLTVVTPPGAALPLLTELLAAPDVQRLRRAALEQLAAAAPIGTDSSSHAAATGGPSGSSGARRTAAGRWKLLLLVLPPRLIRRVASELESQMVHVHVIIVGAAFNLPIRLQLGGDSPAFASSNARRAAATRLLPPPQLLAALAARCSRTVCAEVEAEILGLTTAAAAADSSGVLSVKRTCVFLVTQLAGVALVANGLAAAGGAAGVADMVEALAWVLRMMAAVAADDFRSAGAATLPAVPPESVVQALAKILVGWGSLSATTRAEVVQRLRPIRLMQSVDRLLRGYAADAAQMERAREIAATAVMVLSTTVLSDLLRSHIATRSATAGGGGWRPQDELGPLLTAAKLARREAEQLSLLQLAAQAADPTGPVPPLVQELAMGMGVVSKDVAALLASITAAVVEGSAEAAWAAAAAREAAALMSMTLLPLLERLVELYLAGAAGTHGGGGDGGHVVGLPPDGDVAVGCNHLLVTVSRCLGPAVQLLPAAYLLPLRPQRMLALLGRLLQRAHELRRPGTAGRRRHGSGSGGRGRGRRGEQSESDKACTGAAREAAGMLARMAADEQLAGTVAGWLRGVAVVEGRQQQTQPPQQPPCSTLDAGALAAALRPWDPAAADAVMSLHAAATTGSPRANVEGEGGGSSSSRGPGAAASGDGAVAPLQAAARAVLSHGQPSLNWRILGGGAGDAPAWPPHVLRLCGNPGCRNFAGPSEASLPLRKCAGCKGVRYCGADCQRQHWRGGGHKEECAQLAEAAQAGGCGE